MDNIDACLDHLALESDDPERLATFYADTMGMTVSALGDGFLCRGPRRTLIVTAGTPRKLRFVAYRVRNDDVLSALAARLATADVPLEVDADAQFGAGMLAFRDPDDHLLIFGRAPHSSAPSGDGMPARLQHCVFASRNAERLARFYESVVGFRLSDRVLDRDEGLRTAFFRSDQEHHSIAVFQANEDRIDHHCYETPDWNAIRDWADHLARRNVQLVWGPGRHGPGNNLFVFFNDSDGNWVELSAELEVVSESRAAGVWPHEERTLNSWGRGRLRS